MYRELVQNLSKEQIDKLQAQGVARSIVSNWKHDKRLPTRPQTVLLAQVCNVDPMELEKELMLMETPPEQRDLFKRLMGVAASVFLIVGMVGAPGNTNADQGSRPLTRGGHAVHIVASVCRARRRIDSAFLAIRRGWNVLTFGTC